LSGVVEELLQLLEACRATLLFASLRASKALRMTADVALLCASG
jgi:hypothetical protein